MTRLVLPAAIALFAVLADPGPAEACSVTRTFVAPTNLELVAESPEIVVAKAISGTAGIGTVHFEVTQVLRGTKLTKRAMLLMSGSVDRYLGASPDRFKFSSARPGAYSGACNAWDYAIDKHYLFLLEPGLGMVTIPFARSNEEIDPASDPWLTAVTEYVKIADAPVASRRTLIDALIARGTGKKPSKAAAAIAADLTTHLATPTPYKSFVELDALLRAAPDDHTRKRAVMAIGTGSDPLARQFLVDLLAAVGAKTANVDDFTAYAAIGSYFERFPDPAAIGAIISHYTAAKAQGHDRWSLMLAITKHADASHQKDMFFALTTASDEEAGRFVGYFARFPSKDATSNIRRRIKNDFEKARFELVIGIAGMGDADVIKWAEKKLAAKPDDNRWIALYAIARSPRPNANAIARKVIAKNDADLATLIDGYGEAEHREVDARLRQIGTLKLSTEAADALQRALANRAKR
ncbi:MAG TPA: hypothetical protein VIU61_20485 [Kofleriaceae bacterium]